MLCHCRIIILQRLPKRMISIGSLTIIIIIHMASLFFIQTVFVPDEYWQSLEVAHNIVFHYGNLTWEWQEGLRSYIYPSMFAILYKALQFFEVDSVNMVVMAPRFLQACISIISDAYFFCWVSKEIPGAGALAIFVISTAWFWLFCSSRTLVNTMETSLSAIALYYYPWPEDKSKRKSLPFLGLVGVAGIIRPTAVIPWVPLCLHHVITSPNKIRRALSEYFLVGLLCLCILLLVDCYFYKQFILTPINFLFVNVLKNVSNFYGTHSVHWYLSSGLPTVLGLHLIPFVLGCMKSFSHSDMPVKIIKLLCVSVLFTIGIYSFLPHKEFRFILPILPMALFVSTSWFFHFQKISRYIASVLYVIFILASVIPCLYLGLFHQRGTVDVMQDLAKDAMDNPHHTDLLFLMPCHSTPLYSYLHVNVSARYLTCDPRDLFHSNLLRDEADEFYLAPVAWLEKNLNSLPSHIIMFDILYSQIAEFLYSRSYKVFNCYHHAHITEGRVGQAVYILKQGAV